MAKVPTLTKGNCLIFSILFWLKNPKARILVKWNKRRKVPSFIPIFEGRQYIYKPKNTKQPFKIIFHGKITVI